MTHRSTVADRNLALSTWYESQSRSLPWRRTPDPYYTLVSEFMLQQTQVERVLPKFRAFVERWPTAEDLAESLPSQVLEMWSGLGYNSRALRLRSSAQIIASSGWPKSPQGLTELPGVGPYTARAIASIAFGESVPAIDTNLRRVLSRWFGARIDGDELVSFAQVCLGEPAGTWNQAMMDLGATICRPRNPECSVCPVSDWCTDPTVYAPPTRQSRFRGSTRELRGALVRASLDGADLYATGTSLGRTKKQIDTAIETLRTEGLLPSEC
ncbi:MAG: A/G-specific adenine glycosylase [Acidimicrobiia bacterium]